MIADTDARGLVLAVGHVEELRPGMIALKRRLDEGQIGQIYQIAARRLSPFPDRGLGSRRRARSRDPRHQRDALPERIGG